MVSEQETCLVKTYFVYSLRFFADGRSKNDFDIVANNILINKLWFVAIRLQNKNGIYDKKKWRI